MFHEKFGGVSAETRLSGIFSDTETLQQPTEVWIVRFVT
jgi:hypothetical protein